MNTAKQISTFISYSRSDEKFALRLAKKLKSAGYLVWLDQLDIPPGTHWEEELERALRESEIFLVILTPASIDSENVKDEIALALNLEKRILPILLEECVIPMRLSRIQYADFRKTRFSDGTKRVEQLLETLIKEQLTASVKSEPEPEVPNIPGKGLLQIASDSNKRTSIPASAQVARYWLPAALLMLLGIVIAAYFIYMGNRPSVQATQIPNTPVQTQPFTVFVTLEGQVEQKEPAFPLLVTTPAEVSIRVELPDDSVDHHCKWAVLRSLPNPPPDTESCSWSFLLPTFNDTSVRVIVFTSDENSFERILIFRPE